MHATPTNRWRYMMRALDPEVVDVVWETIEPMIPRPAKRHPLGCHRSRISDRLCFWGILVRLVTGASWVTVEAVLERRVGHDVAVPP